MILLDEDSKSFLYKAPRSVSNNNRNHALYEIALNLKGDNHLEPIDRTIEFVNEIVDKFNTPFEKIIFGGTELEIIKRGSDWWIDISRIGAALLQCLGMSSRNAILVNPFKAYHGHQVVEVYLDSTYMMCDFLYGVIARLDQNYSVYDLLSKPKLVHGIYSSKINDSKQFDYITRLYNLAAISEYDISKKHNYQTANPNEYYQKNDESQSRWSLANEWR